ncbi:MAG TPA: hypothetical protein VE155_07180 [Pseudonocardiaceae bacterium]|nr:hypothetical protein [Pseudonocardiaceae bacterium]
MIGVKPIARCRVPHPARLIAVLRPLISEQAQHVEQCHCVRRIGRATLHHDPGTAVHLF